MNIDERRRSGRISRILLPLTCGGRFASRLAAGGRSPGRMSRAAIIHLGGLSPGRSSTLPAAQSRRAASRCLFGLAGGGVCHAATVTRDAVRSYRTFSPLPLTCGRSFASRFVADGQSLGRMSRAVCFLWHCPSARAGLPLATTVPCPVRTFLPAGVRTPTERSPRPLRQYVLYRSE